MDLAACDDHWRACAASCDDWGVSYSKKRSYRKHLDTITSEDKVRFTVGFRFVSGSFQVRQGRRKNCRRETNGVELHECCAVHHLTVTRPGLPSSPSHTTSRS